ncbi:hypothetical protein HYT05_00395 [Candidatus Kaiserbacteria bacterium]|nr:hypothetical protein [Candidatus Kaiserbacteria bacterium]
MRATAISRRRLCAGAVASLATVFAAAPVQARHRYIAPKKFPITAENIRRLVTDHIRIASPHEMEKRVCSDDRIDKDDGATAIFGADGGALSDLLALVNMLGKADIVIDHRDAIGAFLTTVGGSPKVCYHTDEKTDGKDGRGCAHCRLVQERYWNYGLTPELAELFRQTLIQAEARPDVLIGEHAPSMFLSLRQKGEIKADGSGALILDHKIKINDVQVQAFVYRPDLVMRQIKMLARNLVFYSSALRASRIGEEGVVALLWAIQKHNRAATAREVAAAVPHFIATVDEDRVCREVQIL